MGRRPPKNQYFITLNKKDSSKAIKEYFKIEFETSKLHIKSKFCSKSQNYRKYRRKNKIQEVYRRFSIFTGNTGGVGTLEAT